MASRGKASRSERDCLPACITYTEFQGTDYADSSVDFDESSPDEFDSANPYEDPVSMLDMREHTVREKWIDIEKAKIIREKLYWCYCIEGVNHLQKYCHLVH
ncbi:Complex I subunit NDUFS6 [Prunus dulcis]|uniref:Complex I subunit NDUFS6 n=1 Tax=Prunus dulcis TaxID=3755 RepID=A0A4Y1QXT9_PRUDU|nr:Complex I subunit NDUFS6 [Prunus dulcis]